MSIRRSVPIAVTDEVEAMLTPELRGMMDKLNEIVLDVADADGVPVRCMLYNLFRYPEDDWSEIINIIEVDVPTEQTLDFMDEVGAAVDTWLSTLPPDRQRAFDAAFGLDVRRSMR
ncbi:MAG: hypothetical protein NTZ05_06225 [Chloroflexi bacterium]|nr:hypothetical protein [Chloroflexota bacterium]